MENVEETVKVKCTNFITEPVELTTWNVIINKNVINCLKVVYF
jgi:hypothetical protein